MKTHLVHTSAALLAFMLSGAAFGAQQTVAPAQAAPTDNAAAAATSPAATPAYAYSKIRIVRLSEVKGTVQLDRETGRGFEVAMSNMPIIEGSRLQTGVGVAEVEFEDNSTLRLGPASLVEFPRLELLPSGAKASTVKVLKGMAYVSLTRSKDNDLTLLFGQQQLRLQPGSHIRLQLEPTEATVAVWDGTAQVQGPSGATDVGKKKTATFNLTSANQPVVVAKDVAPNQFDSWDHNATEYHQRYAKASAFGNSPNSYGVSDMLYYGSFSNVGGCGSMWQPYFVSASWDPYSNGAYAWYPGAGYSWVSPYPWGWMPYHSGSWNYCPGAGWGWQPGGSWNGINNVPALSPVNVSKHPPLRVPRPPAGPPVPGRPTLLSVGTRQLTPSAMGSADTFVFRNDSAGLGIPRGNLGKLDKISHAVATHGPVSMAAYSAAPTSAQGNGQLGRSGPSSTAQPVSTARQGSMNRGSLNQGSQNQGLQNHPGLQSQGPLNQSGLGAPTAGMGVSAGRMSAGSAAPSSGSGGAGRH